MLGVKKTRNAIVGSLLFPMFVWLTDFFVPYLSFDNVEMLVIAIFGGVLSGLGYGLIYKTNFIIFILSIDMNYYFTSCWISSCFNI